MRGEDNLTAKAYNRLGVVYMEIGDYDLALANYLKANRNFKLNGETEQLFKNHLRIAELYFKISWIEKRDKIMQHGKLADSLSLTFNLKPLDELRLNQFWGNLRITYKEYDQALTYHQKGLELSLVRQDSVDIARCYSNMGACYKNSGNLEESIFCYEKAFAYAFNKPHIEAIVHDNLGDYYLFTQSYQKRVDALSKCHFKVIREKR